MVLRGRWFWVFVVVLVVSLGLNVLALGAFGALRMAGHMGVGPLGGGPHFVGQSIPAEARPYMRQAFRDVLPTLRQTRPELNASRARIAEAARAEPFSADDLRAALAAHGVLQDRARNAFFDAITNAVGDMPPELRQELNLEKFRFGPGGPRRGPPHGPRPEPPGE